MWTLQLEVNRALYADEAMLAKNELFDNVANDISEAIINLAENIKRR
jgi:N-formylglutamate amidohydrolase